MICTCLHVYYSRGDNTNLPTALRWADRECRNHRITARYKADFRRHVLNGPGEPAQLCRTGSRAPEKTRFPAPPTVVLNRKYAVVQGKEDYLRRGGS